MELGRIGRLPVCWALASGAGSGMAQSSRTPGAYDLPLESWGSFPTGREVRGGTVSLEHEN